MLTSKQRAYLRAMANSIETILMVGKGGISADIVKQANDALKARELIAGDSAAFSARYSRRNCRKNKV